MLSALAIGHPRQRRVPLLVCKNRNFMHQVGDQPELYYDARSTNHQDKKNV